MAVLSVQTKKFTDIPPVSASDPADCLLVHTGDGVRSIAARDFTSGKATAAEKLAAAREIALTGSVTGTANFDGSGNISIATTVASPGINLLDNPDFRNPVNQRGVTDWSGGYGIDRWHIYAGNNNSLRAELMPNGLTLRKLPEYAFWEAMVQQIEFPESYVGRALTLSAKVNGVVTSGSCVVPNITDYWHAIISIGFADLNIYQNRLAVHISLRDSSDQATIEWIKLEEGTVATPFVPPNYELELLKCMRFYQEVGAGWEVILNDNFSLDIAGQFLVPMRITPTISLGEGFNAIRRWNHIYDTSPQPWSIPIGYTNANNRGMSMCIFDDDRSTSVLNPNALNGPFPAAYYISQNSKIILSADL